VSARPGHYRSSATSTAPDPHHVDSAPHLVVVGLLAAALVAWGCSVIRRHGATGRYRVPDHSWPSVRSVSPGTSRCSCRCPVPSTRLTTGSAGLVGARRCARSAGCGHRHLPSLVNQRPLVASSQCRSRRRCPPSTFVARPRRPPTRNRRSGRACSNNGRRVRARCLAGAPVPP
jgi:hypothetical protein